MRGRSGRRGAQPLYGSRRGRRFTMTCDSVPGRVPRMRRGTGTLLWGGQEWRVHVGCGDGWVDPGIRGGV